MSIVALVLTALFSALGLLFALGYAWEDPGGWPAVLITAAVVLPLGGLTWLVAGAPRAGSWALQIGIAVYAIWALLSQFVPLVEAPVIPIFALILAVPTAVLGLREPLRAGLLMLSLAVVPFVCLLIRLAREAGPEGPSLGNLLGGSTGVVVVPLGVLAALMLTAAALDRHRAAVPPQPIAR
ncbi:MAG TPA: hypothetical protein VFP34_08885 [Microlunatus sp.]|nr:hypothetical protein [Microlunatus sp.]